MDTSAQASVTIPQHAQILVIGGGPAGAYAASALANEGFDVVLFEASIFPRYHIGESLIPSVRHYLRFIDAERKVEDAGFARKPGAAMKLNQHKLEGYTDFLALGPNGYAWNVTRAEFDALLLAHAAEAGAHVYHNVKVTELHFDKTVHDDGRLGRATSATYTIKADGGVRTGTIGFDYVVDASGRTGLISTKYAKNRKYTESLKNLALWGYWRGTSKYMADSGMNRENAAYFEALTDESGWAWFIPLANGITSVGIVVNQEVYNAYFSDGGKSLSERYTTMLAFAPNLTGLIRGGTLASDIVGPDERGGVQTQPMVKMASDFSYSAGEYAGENWRIAGDAGAFIDPFFSSGIHLAMTGGLAAATSIAASIRKDCAEHIAAAWHSRRIGVSYTRFLVVVLGAYKQIRSQAATALADIDEDNFDRAFSMIRPIIQGAGDMGARLHDAELADAVDFCGKLIVPTDPVVLGAVKKGLVDSKEGALLDVNAPVQTSAELARAVDGLTEKQDALLLLEKVNARRVIHKEHSGMDNFEGEPLALGEEGMWAARVRRGALGLVPGSGQRI